MDAKITKQRLAVFLSYDWLKILGVVAAAILLLYVLFVMITTRPTIAQVYTVYTYYGLNIGRDSPSLERNLNGKFSYEILEVEMENFEEGSLGEQALSARRGVLEGDVVLAAGFTEAQDGITPFERVCANYTSFIAGPQVTLKGFYDIPAFMEETRNYLTRFFDLPQTETDETFTGGEPIAERVEEAFYGRNGSDKRFKTQAQKEAGVAEERARVLKIREDFTAVEKAFANGDLYTVDYAYTPEGGEEFRFPVGIGLGRLTGLSDLFYYYNGGSVSTEKLTLLFFDNGYRVEDAKYENWAFLRYLLDRYAPAHS